jgi:hypothetical protein
MPEEAHQIWELQWPHKARTLKTKEAQSKTVKLHIKNLKHHLEEANKETLRWGKCRSLSSTCTNLSKNMTKNASKTSFQGKLWRNICTLFLIKDTALGLLQFLGLLLLLQELKHIQRWILTSFNLEKFLKVKFLNFTDLIHQALKNNWILC